MPDTRCDIFRIIDGLQHMLETWTAGRKKSSTRSAPPSVMSVLDYLLLNEWLRFRPSFQRFSFFREGEASCSDEGVGIAAKCNSSDDLSK